MKKRRIKMDKENLNTIFKTDKNTDITYSRNETSTEFDVSKNAQSSKAEESTFKKAYVSAAKKFNNSSKNTKKAIVIASLVVAYLLGIGSHMIVGVKRSDYDSLISQSVNQKQQIEQKQQQIEQANAKIAESDNKIKEYESIIQPYKDLSAAQIAEQTAAANWKAAQDKKALEEQQAAEKAAAEKAAAEKAAAEKAAAEAAAAEAAKGYETGITYNQLARTPDNYKGKKVKFKGKVVQVMEGTTDTQIRLAVNSNYDTIIYATVPKAKTTNMRILEDDIITIFGVSSGLITYTSTLGGNITIPAVSVDDWGPN